MLTSLLVFATIFELFDTGWKFWGNCSGTVGELFWNFWGAVGELVWNFWGTFRELDYNCWGPIREQYGEEASP